MTDLIVTGTWRRDGSRNLIVGVGQSNGDPATTRYVINDPELVITNGVAVVNEDESHVIIAGVTYAVGAFDERQNVWALTAQE